jgi:ketosteroid isomerase-like protein
MPIRSRAFVPCVTLVVAIAAVSGPSAFAQGVRSDQQILIELEQRWDEAFHKQDAMFIESVLADEFIATYGDGSRGDKAKEISLATESKQQVDSRRLDEFIVKTFGNTAVVWFTQHLVGPVNGKPTEVVYRYVDVWVIRDGRWLCVASQSTRVGAK